MVNKALNIRRLILLLAIAWSVFMTFTMGYQMKHIQTDTEQNGLIQARIAFAKDVVFRNWNAMMGGVYVKISEKIQPNPYLNVENKNVVTTDGQQLTLINPAYMTRMVHELEHSEQGGALGHLTSLDPINPDNAPDQWERQALLRFSQGEDIYYSVEEIGDTEYLRYMRPFIVAQPCLKCHGHQGYKIGDIRGGISVSVPMAPLHALQQDDLQNSFKVHFLLWLMGLLGFIGVGLYMTRQQKQQQQVENELLKSKLTLDQIHDCVFIFSPDTLRFTYVNQGAINQVGYSAEELLSMTPVDIKPDFTEDAFRELIAPLVENSGHSLSFETIHWHKDGFVVPVEIKLQYLNLGDDDEGRFVVVARDLSERNKEKEEYKRLFEASRDAIVVTTQEGFIDCNQAALDQFGYESKKEFLSLSPAAVSPEMQANGISSKEAAEKHIADAIDNKIALFPWLHLHKDGTEFPAEVMLSPFERNGETVVQGVVRDLSERQRAEKDKEKMQAKLLHAQKLESVGQLAAGIAHEINTPTQFVGTNLDFMDEAAQDIASFMSRLKKIAEKAPEETAEAIQQALEEADWDYLAEELPQAISQSKEGVKRVSSIVRAMKEFSHPGTKEKSATDLNRLVQTTITVARNEWKYVAEVELNLDESLPPASCLSDEMGQVLLNILVNGAHAIAERLGDNPEGVKGLITVTTSHDAENVYIRIKDSGSGIPQAAQKRIFDPFFTTKSVGKGTGQGLAIAHDVVTEKHGGSLTFETESGAGTTFIITLPLAKENNSSEIEE